jgi:hypothetical protein
LPPKEKSPVSSDFAVVGTSLKKEDAAMSATKVRNDAYQQSEEFWKTKYRPFYKIEYDEADKEKDFTDEIYAAIKSKQGVKFVQPPKPKTEKVKAKGGTRKNRK